MEASAPGDAPVVEVIPNELHPTACPLRHVPVRCASRRAHGHVLDKSSPSADLAGQSLGLVTQGHIRIRLTRPVSAGTGDNMHHLHIRQLEVLDHSREKIPLKYVAASKQMAAAASGKLSPRYAIDGKLSTYNHNAYGGTWEYGCEDHWMEFECESQVVSSVLLYIYPYPEENPFTWQRIVGARIESWSVSSMLGGRRDLRVHFLQRQDVQNLKLYEPFEWRWEEDISCRVIM